MNTAPPAEAEIRYALVCLESGALLDVLEAGAPSPRLLDLAAATPELLRAGAAADLGALFARLGSEREPEDLASFRELVFVSAQAVHVVLTLSRRPRIALIAVSADAASVGLVLSGAHAHRSRLEAAA